MIPIAQLTSQRPDLKGKNDPKTLAELDFRGPVVPQGAYIHVPFCFHKCHYCDFFSIVDSPARHEAFVDRIERELAWAGGLLKQPLETVFVGGGTPTLLKPALLGRVLDGVRRHLPLAPDVEFTTEANPETVSASIVDKLSAAGVNRVSIGAQSFDPRHLKTLERWHDPASVSRAVDLVRHGGIESINVDMIFAIPDQTTEDWRRDLEKALSLGPDHVSCYGLTYEPNTPMDRRLARGDFEPVGDDDEAEMYETSRSMLREAGYEHYEISAWAKPGHRCRHNLLYWTSAEWWAVGPSASGHVNGIRWKNASRLTDYLESRDAPPIAEFERCEADVAVGEKLMMGLRLLDGVNLERLEDWLSADVRSVQRRRAIEKHRRGGLLECRDGALALSSRGLLLANEVLVDLL